MSGKSHKKFFVLINAYVHTRIHRHWQALNRPRQRIFASVCVYLSWVYKLWDRFWVICSWLAQNMAVAITLHFNIHVLNNLGFRLSKELVSHNVKFCYKRKSFSETEKLGSTRQWARWSHKQELIWMHLAQTFLWKLIGLYWKLMRRQFWTLTCPIGPCCQGGEFITLCNTVCIQSKTVLLTVCSCRNPEGAALFSHSMRPV